MARRLLGPHETLLCVLMYATRIILKYFLGVFGVVYKGIYSRNGIAVEVAIKTIRYEGYLFLYASV